jgi:HK97 family phage prohead protease
MLFKHFSRPLHLKELSSDGMFSGYASVFGQVDAHDETVAAGAFTKTLSAWRQSGRSPAMLWMHDPAQPIGVWLSLREDGNGLAVDGRLALRTQKGAEAHELLRLGALTGLSIGYRVVASQIDATKKIRTLKEIELFEISLVTFPANDEARVERVNDGAADGNEMRAIAASLRRAAHVLKEKPKKS